MKHTINIQDKAIQRVVRDIDYKILCDGMQYGIITHEKQELVVCRPRNAQGDGYGDWSPEDMSQAEQDMQTLDTALEPSEEERLSLLEPIPFDAGTCTCGEFVAAGRLHEHRCPDPVREMRMIESEAWKRYLSGDLDPRTREF